MVLKPFPVFVFAAGVEDDYEVVFGEAIDNDVVDDAAGFVQQQRVLRLAGRQFGDIVSRDVLEEIKAPGPVTRASPMWDTSNRPARSRTAATSPTVPR